MARKKKVEEIAEEILAVEEIVEEIPATEEVVEVEAEEIQEELPLIHSVTLKGSIGSQFHGSVNGVNFAYPCGVELEVPEHIYHAVKAHLA